MNCVEGCSDETEATHVTAYTMFDITDCPYAGPWRRSTIGGPNSVSRHVGRHAMTATSNFMHRCFAQRGSRAVELKTAMTLAATELRNPTEDPD